MAASVLVDAGFLIALLSRRDANHGWAVAQAQRFPLPWKTCDAALSEAFHLLGPAWRSGSHVAVAAPRRRQRLSLGRTPEEVLRLMQASMPTCR